MARTRAQAAAQELELRRRLDRQECKASSAVFTERHVKIETPVGEVIPFKLWKFQRKTLKTLEDEEKVIVLKARRLGISWLVLAFALWLAIFNQGIRILILCKNEDDANELLDRVRRIKERMHADPASRHLVDGLPRRPSRAKEKDNVGTLEVGLSTIRALVATPRAARQETAGFLILEEFAFAADSGEIWAGALPTIEGGGKVAVVSTGNGIRKHGREFARQWSRAASKASRFVGLFWPWDARPGRDQAWLDEAREDLGDDERARREYPETPEDAFVEPDVDFTFVRSHIEAAVAKGREFDALLDKGEMPPPVGGQLILGVDWGDFATHAVLLWPLERGGVYVVSELATTRLDPEKITLKMLGLADPYPYWLAEQRYDASFAQSNRTFVRVAESLLGPHNAVRKEGRPNTRPIPFNRDKHEAIGYVRQISRRTADGRKLRILGISERCPILIEQAVHYVEHEKENDDAVDALLAGIAPTARKHRKVVGDDRDREARYDRRAA